jgi:glycosyltransferase involved in cell wall biosynthesis
MRVGVNVFHLGPGIGGLRQYFLSLLPALLDAEPRNHYLLFHSAAGSAETEALVGPRVHRVLVSRAREVRGCLERLDLYFCPFGILDPRPLPLPSVVTLVDVQEKYLPGFFSGAELWNRALHYEASTHQADAVVTISEFSRASIALKHRLPEERIHVAPLCASPELLSAGEPDPSFAAELPSGFVFYPANPWRHKNHELLLRAIRLLRDERGLVVPLVLTGFEQPNGFPLAQSVRELGLAAQTKFLGFVSLAELKHLYRHAGVLCFPSRFEGFGLPLVEAMALGCPVAAADATSIPEVVGDASLLFDPSDMRGCADALARILEDGALREALVAAGLQRARLFQPARMAAAHLEAFEAARCRFSFLRYLRQRVAADPLHRLRHYARFGIRPPLSGPSEAPRPASRAGSA